MSIEDLLEKQKREEQEKKGKQAKKIKSLDDGTVKGLILSGNYRNIGHTVIVQLNSENALYASINDDEFKEYIKNNDSNDYWTWNNVDEYISDVVTVCRRKLKKEKLLLCSLLNYSCKNMSGQAFTDEKVYVFDGGKLQYIITYDEIEDADFEEDAVILKLTGGEEVKLYCHDGDNYKSLRHYSRSLFNFIMDIKDRLDEQ